MKLDTAVRTLGPVDHVAFRAAVLGVPKEAWLEDTSRQERFAEYHNQTQTIILLFSDGWPDISISRRSGWRRFSAHAWPIVQKILADHYRPGGHVLRAMVAKLVAGGIVTPHEDVHPSFAIAHRVHVPLITNDLVDFTVADETFHLQEGVAYEISNLDTHGVHNRSSEDRVHFIFDYAEPK